MRLGLVMAFVSFVMLVAAPVSLADDSQPIAPVQMADVAKGKTPSIAYGGGTQHVAFQDNESILYSESSDGGKSWGSAVKISGPVLSCSHPVIAAGADGSVNIVWQGKASGKKTTGIFFVRSSDGGKSFSEPVDVSGTPTASSEPQLAIGTDNSLHLVWIDALPSPAGPDVFYIASSDGGKTWSKREDVSNTPGGVSSNPAIAVGADARVHVAWSDTSSGEESPDVFYVRKLDRNWSAPQDLSKDSGYSALPSIGCGKNGKVYIAWTDNSKKVVGDIWCLIEKSDCQFGKPINVSNSRGISSQPALSVDQRDRLVVVWIDTSLTQKVPDIWARIGNEASFSKSIQLCSTRGESIHPAVILADKKAYTVWEEVDGGSSTVKGCTLQLK